jgi:spermidine/putrescine transport system ATP-binding protein
VTVAETATDRPSTEAASAPPMGIADGAPDVELLDVTKRFGEVVAVDAMTLRIPRGSFTSLLGPSGCGKTTTLRMIAGFEQPTEGEILLAGRPIAGVPPYQRSVNTVFQHYALFPHMDVAQNVGYGLRQKKVGKQEERRRASEALDLVRLAGYERRRVWELSGGRQQRVALARALVNKPRVLLLDEPLGALDLKLRKQMQLELKAIQHDVGITFVHVTHDQEEAMTMADQIAVMNQGHVEQLGAPEELYERPATAFVAGFLGASNLLSGVIEGPDAVRLAEGTLVHAQVDGKSGPVAAGVRPEKITVGESGGQNRLPGRVVETAYIGVATQLVVDTAAGTVQVFAQNIDSGKRTPEPGSNVTLSWSPESTFVVERGEEMSE